ncbi:MAG: YkgJ family cysteine cluster protein [Bdellovibrionaceae bacterium]|nr:YkgJ family cysteine cluster protein [Pseudobdellovibrionaceae bacterium]
MTCGACCAYFRVAFYWREAELSDSPHPVPKGLFVELDSQKRAMKGTEQKHHQKCCALEGRVGERVNCRIYDNRPTPCRQFEASFESGVHNPRCDEARRAHGLAPLSGKDWKGHGPSQGPKKPDHDRDL